MDIDYAEEMYGAPSSPTPKYFDNISFREYPRCSGCKMRNLVIQNTRLCGDLKMDFETSTVYCEHEKLCERLWAAASHGRA